MNSWAIGAAPLRDFILEAIHIGGHALLAQLQRADKAPLACAADDAPEPLDYRMIAEICGRRGDEIPHPWRCSQLLSVFLGRPRFAGAAVGRPL